METNQWRLLLSPEPVNGPWNMAVDEAILESVEAGQNLPTLRLYAWAPPCLSLGFSQPISDVDIQAVTRLGWDLVRRPTGGRAILHTDEITYAVIGPATNPHLAGSVLESYCRIARALLRVLELIGVSAAAKETNQPAVKQSNPVCFEVPSNYEITANGKKLLGSAQARRRNGVLQHGALPLKGDITRILEGLVYLDDSVRKNASERLLLHAVTLESITGKIIPWDQAAQAFIQGFEEILNVSFIPSELSPSELAHARELLQQKYLNSEWTARL